MALLGGWPVLLAVIAIGCGTRSLDPGLPDGAGGGGTGGSGGGGSGGAEITLADGGPDTIGRLDGPSTDRYIPDLTCGNGIVDPGEACDDHNRTSRDGCSAICQIECFSSCDGCGPPGTCLVSSRCGDGKRDSNEACDDSNAVSDDGCYETCTVIEPGWICPLPGHRCVPICGDGRKVGPETCDDGNAVGGDGCSEICVSEPAAARCGDGMISGAEECDDGAGNDDRVYGGCTTQCRFGGHCGDAVLNGAEQCDSGTRGNTVTYGNQDGCGPDCRFPSFCGDAVVNTDEGEQCDRGPLNGGPDWICTIDCKIPI
jgi:cysteine-rich repeat protein